MNLTKFNQFNTVGIMGLVVWAFLCAIFHPNAADYAWSSNSYTLKAVLTVPSANISEPYTVWLDGDTGKARVDFYDGLDKLYREYDEKNKQYKYYKIHPFPIKDMKVTEVCHEMSAKAPEVKMYAMNTYLPIKRWTYVGPDHLMNMETKKFVYEYPVKIDGKVGGKVIYTIWINTNEKPGIKIPVRFVYELKHGTKMLDNFQHDYTYYDASKPDPVHFEKPKDIKCNPLPVDSFHQPIDPLVEYIEPDIEHTRVEKAFDRFKTEQNKIYKNNDEHLKRMNIFKNNLRFINSFNRQHRSFKVGVNHLADFTKEEIKVFLGTLPKNEKVAEEGSGDYDEDDDEINDVNNLSGSHNKFDWRDYGAVSSIKDQTPMCGSCYAFVTTAAIESSAYVARGCQHLDEVSEQAIIDCTWGEGGHGNLGCTGGTYEYALSWIKSHGVPLKSEYGPYLALEGRCHIKDMTKLVMIQDYTQLEKKKKIIKDTLREKGPLLASIDSSHESFIFYTNGIYDEPKCSNNPDDRTHGVTIVGYGNSDGREYWIIKNSFGEDWGEKGYMRIDVRRNLCGLKNFVYSVDFKINKSKDCKHLNTMSEQTNSTSAAIII